MMMMKRSLALAPPPCRLSFLLLRRRRDITTSSSSSILISPAELSEIDALTRRLCALNHTQPAIRLLSAALLATPPALLAALPVLTEHVASLPDLTPSISLLNTLRRHNPPPVPVIPYTSSLLIRSFLRRRRLDAAVKIFSWLLKEDSPCRPGEGLYREFVGGVCGSEEGRAWDVVRGVREMVRDHGWVGNGDEEEEVVKGWVRESLLREARVDEALELEEAFNHHRKEKNDCHDDDGKVNVGELLDRILKDWED